MVQSMTNSRQASRSEALSSRGGRTAENTESSTSILGSHVPSSGDASFSQSGSHRSSSVAGDETSHTRSNLTYSTRGASRSTVPVPRTASASLKDEEGADADQIEIVVQDESVPKSGSFMSRLSGRGSVRSTSVKSKGSSLRSRLSKAMSGVTRFSAGKPFFAGSKGTGGDGGEDGEEEGEEGGGGNDDDDEDGEEDDDLTYLSVACGYSHTMFITENRLILSCGNHRNGQLGIDERKEEIVVITCDRCFTVQAKYFCQSCERQQGMDRDVALCEVCCITVHKLKINKLHEPEEIPPPENKKCRISPKTVKTWLDVDMQRRDGEDEELTDELRLMPKRRKMLADLAPVYQVACGVTHTMAIVKLDEETGEGDVYAWGCGGSGRTGFCRPLISGTYLADSDDEEEGGGGMEEGSRLVEWTASDARDTFAATRVYDCYAAWESRQLSKKMREETAEDSGDDETEDEDDIDDDDVLKRSHLEKFPLRAKAIACGGQHSLALKADGQLLSCGNNEHGQLGRELDPWEEHGTHLFRPVAIGTDYTVTQIACGDIHCIAISGNGAHVFTWGSGKNGRLGHGDTEDVIIPRVVQGIGSFFDPSKNIVGAGCGGAHTAVVCDDGSVYVWGSNSSGQCGVFDEPSLDQVNNVEANRPPDVLVPTKVDFPASKRKSQVEKGAGGKNLNGQSSRTLEVSKSAATLGARESERNMTGSGDRSSFWFSGRRADNTCDSPQKGSTKGGGTPKRMSVDSKKGLWSSLSKPNKNESSRKSNAGNTPQGTSGRWGLSSVRGSVQESSLAAEEEKEPKTNMVECGDCHTLVLRRDGELWLLGSGMDRRYRRQNSSIKVGDGKKIKDTVQLDPAFLPRQVVTCFSDTAEISTIPGAPGVIHDSIYCSRVHIVIPDPEDPEAPPTEEEHFTFTFAFDGDLDIKSGDQVAFTGPSAVEGLKLISVEDGPWFTVLGGTCDWDQQMGPGKTPGRHDNGEGVKKIKWRDERNRITVKIDPNMVSSNDVSFEGLCDAAQRLNDSVRTDDTRNMLVCLKDELPPLKLISSGAYHALLLSEENKMFVWGMGRIGRLGLGNELDQKVPVALEAEVTDVGNVELEPDDDGFEVMISADDDAEPNPKFEHFKTGDVILAIDDTRVYGSQSVSEVMKLLKGPECSSAMVEFKRKIQVWSNEMGEYVDEWVQYVEFIPRGVDEDDQTVRT